MEPTSVTKAMILIGSPQQERTSGKTCILGMARYSRRPGRHRNQLSKRPFDRPGKIFARRVPPVADRTVLSLMTCSSGRSARRRSTGRKYRGSARERQARNGFPRRHGRSTLGGTKGERVGTSTVVATGPVASDGRGEGRRGRTASPPSGGSLAGREAERRRRGLPPRPQPARPRRRPGGSCRAACPAVRLSNLSGEARSLVSTAFDLAHEALVLLGRRAGLVAGRDGYHRQSRPGSNPPQGPNAPSRIPAASGAGSTTALDSVEGMFL